MTSDDWDPLAEDAACETTYASIILRGPRLRPEAVTEILGVGPTKGWNRGDRHRTFTGDELVRRDGFWELTTDGRLSSRSLERHILFLLEQFASREDELVRVVREHAALALISCFWVSALGHDGPIFSPNLMGHLSRLGLPLWVDFYMGEVDEEDEIPPEPGPVDALR